MGKQKLKYQISEPEATLYDSVLGRFKANVLSQACKGLFIQEGSGWEGKNKAQQLSEISWAESYTSWHVVQYHI